MVKVTLLKGKRVQHPAGFEPPTSRSPRDYFSETLAGHGGVPAGRPEMPENDQGRHQERRRLQRRRNRCHFQVSGPLL